MEKIISETEEKLVSKTVKPLRMVDLNNKKHCQVMVEVNFAPAKRITDKELQDTIFLITWDDGSQGHYELVDIVRFTLSDYYSFLTYPSHGMDFFDYYKWFREQYPKVNSETKMAAYFLH